MSLRMQAVMAVFGAFPGGPQALVGLGEGQLVPDGDHDRHEEGAAHAAACAGDCASASQGAAVAIERRQAGAAGDPAAAEAAEFGQFGDQGAGDGVADTGDGFEEVLLLAPGRSAAHGGVDLAFDLAEPGLQLGHDPRQATQHAAVGQLSPTIVLGPDHLDELPAPGNQFAQGLRLGARQRARVGPHGLAKAGDDLGIEPVGLDPPAGGAREISDLARVDDDQRQVCCGQRGRHHRLVTAGRL